MILSTMGWACVWCMPGLWSPFDCSVLTLGAVGARQSCAEHSITGGVGHGTGAETEIILTFVAWLWTKTQVQIFLDYFFAKYTKL